MYDTQLSHQSRTLTQMVHQPKLWLQETATCVSVRAERPGNGIKVDQARRAKIRKRAGTPLNPDGLVASASHVEEILADLP